MEWGGGVGVCVCVCVCVLVLTCSLMSYRSLKGLKVKEVMKEHIGVR